MSSPDGRTDRWTDKLNPVYPPPASLGGGINKFMITVNVGKTLAVQIPKSGPSFHKYLPEANKEYIFLIPTDEREIQNVYLNVRNSAPGYMMGYF